MNPLKDDPNFHIDEDLQDQQDAAYQAAESAGMFQEQGCLHVTSTEVLRSVFTDFNDVFGKRDDAQREQNCNGYFSRMATGRD